MNILFFLTPKALCTYLDEGDSIRQAMERMEQSGYAALPILDKEGHYCATMTEGDILWALKRICVMDIKQTEQHYIREIRPKREIQPVTVNTRVEELITVASEQNFVPVVDDTGAFIGIVTRSSILKYCQENYFRRGV